MPDELELPGLKLMLSPPQPMAIADKPSHSVDVANEIQRIEFLFICIYPSEKSRKVLMRILFGRHWRLQRRRRRTAIGGRWRQNRRGRHDWRRSTICRRDREIRPVRIRRRRRLFRGHLCGLIRSRIVSVFHLARLSATTSNHEPCGNDHGHRRNDARPGAKWAGGFRCVNMSFTSRTANERISH